MILKSFKRKKTTKIYVIIFTLIFTIFELVVIGKSYYKNKINEVYVDSFMTISTNRNINFDTIDNVKDIVRVYENNYYIIFARDDLGIEDDSIIIPSTNHIFEINEEFVLTIGDEKINLTISDKYDRNDSLRVAYVNSNTFNKVISYDDNNVSYAFKLNDWSIYTKTVYDIYSIYNIDPDIYKVNSNKDYFEYLRQYKKYTKIIIAIFMVVCIFSIYNVLSDEEEKVDIYKSLGFNKYIILKNQLINIIYLFSISIINSIIITFIIKNFIFK